MNNESQWTLNEAVGPRFRYCRMFSLEGRQETKKAREDKQTRVTNTLGTQFNRRDCPGKLSNLFALLLSIT